MACLSSTVGGTPSPSSLTITQPQGSCWKSTERQKPREARGYSVGNGMPQGSEDCRGTWSESCVARGLLLVLTERVRSAQGYSSRPW